MTALIHTLWRMSFQACFLIIIVLITRLFLKKYSGLYTRLLWLLVIVRLLCPVFIETKFRLQPNMFSLQMVQENISLLIKDFGSQNIADTKKFPGSEKNHENLLYGNKGDANMPNSSLPQLPQTGAQYQSDILFSQTKHSGQNFNYLTQILPTLSVIGTLTTALIFLLQFLQLKRRISTAICESSNIWLCETITSPFVVGVFHPRIILPYHLNPEARAHILSHEQTHIRHHDPLLHIAGLICLCLHWWNPFVWLAIHKMNQDMEMFCDESTLKFAAQVQRKEYAKTLLSFAEQQSSLHSGPAFGESNTEKRVKNIMKKKKKNFLILGLVILLTVFLTAAFMTIPQTKKTQEDNSEEDNSEKSILHLGAESMYALLNASFAIPDFQTERDMDMNFWRTYLLSVYTNVHEKESVTGCKAELVEHYNRNGAAVSYNKIATEELDRATKLFFGRALSEFLENPDSLADGDFLLFEDGFYYIRTSDSLDYTFGVSKTTFLEDGRTKIVFPKYSKDGDTPLSEITLYIEAAENDNGYILTGKEERTGEITGIRNKDITFIISEEDVFNLQYTTLFMPDFKKEEDLNAAFWNDYLFHSYSYNFSGETVNRYSARRDMITAYAKVDEDMLNHDILALFGKPLSEYLKNPQDLSEEDGDIIYADGCYYICIPKEDSYTFDNTEIHMDADSKNTKITYLKYSQDHAYPESQITLFLAAAENEAGFILVGKEETEYSFINQELTGS